MTIKEYRKALSKLDIIELDGLEYLWKCPHCGKQMRLTAEQVRPMIYKENTLVLCNDCDKLALFVVKRNAKYLWLDKSENTIVKRWSGIGYATAFAESELDEYKDKYEIVPISNFAKEAAKANVIDSYEKLY